MMDAIVRKGSVDEAVVNMKFVLGVVMCVQALLEGHDNAHSRNLFLQWSL
jgi:hypothetical protein